MGGYVQVGSEGEIDHYLGVHQGWGFAGFFLEGVVLVPIREYFALKVLPLSQETGWKEEPN